MSHTGWRGIDLDGTLAHYGAWQGPLHIGEPIPKMVERVKKWRAEGQNIRIFTARVSPHTELDAKDLTAIRTVIEAWCLQHLGEVLPITHEKDYQMFELWDDRAVSVICNTEVVRGGEPPY